MSAVVYSMPDLLDKDFERELRVKGDPVLPSLPAETSAVVIATVATVS